MAAIYGSFDIWSVTLNEVLSNISYALQDDLPIIGLLIGIFVAVLGPVTAVANAIVIAAIWKDPYKQLRSSPSNIIIASMACCDFLVGTVVSFCLALFLIGMSLGVTIHIQYIGQTYPLV